MEIVFLGVSDVGLRIYEWLCNRTNDEVLAMLTTSDQLDLVAELEPDVVVSVGFDHLVPPDILDIPEYGCINLHGAFLPYNRRRNSNVWPIVEDTPAGVTLHYMDEKLDEGKIISQREVSVSFDDTAKDVYERLEGASFDLFVETWPSIREGSVKTVPQGEGGTEHTRLDFEELCHIDSAETYHAKELIDILRATTFPPFDNAYMVIDGHKYYIDVDIRREDEAEEDHNTVGMVDEY